MQKISNLEEEAQEALEKFWFVQSLKEVERTDATLSLRLHIRADLFVQVFFGELSGSLYFALIESGQRVFGIDRESGKWHMHPYGAPYRHEPLGETMGPKPLLRFLSKVEDILIEFDLL